MNIPPLSNAFGKSGFPKIRTHYFQIAHSNYFNDAYFDERYFSQLEWLSKDFKDVEGILNIGCGRGRETFALLLKLTPKKSMGIDCGTLIEDKKKMPKVEDGRTIIHSLAEINRIMEEIAERKATYRPEAFKQMWDWYMSAIPPKFREGLPIFQHEDISKSISLSEKVEMIYCRYVLHIIANNGLEDLTSSISNISSALKDGGKVVIVEPTTTDRGVPLEYSIVDMFKKAGFDVEKTVDESELGYIKSKNTNPEGYIFQKE